jgi:hypothetical protein
VTTLKIRDGHAEDVARGLDPAPTWTAAAKLRTSADDPVLHEEVKGPEPKPPAQPRTTEKPPASAKAAKK